MKAETTALLEKAQAALRAARRDLDAGDADASISRAHYAVYYAHFLKDEPLDREIARTLATPPRRREDATYTFGAVYSLEAAGKATGQAEAFVAAVTDWLEGR